MLTFGLLLACLAAVMFILAVYAAIRPVSLLLKGERSQGLVITDHIYRNSRGRKRRFYRLTVALSTSQTAELRSRSTLSMKLPKIGDSVPVVVWERPAGPKAEIATFGHLWFDVSVFVWLAISFSAFAALVLFGELS